MVALRQKGAYSDTHAAPYSGYIYTRDCKIAQPPTELLGINEISAQEIAERIDRYTSEFADAFMEGRVPGGPCVTDADRSCEELACGLCSKPTFAQLVQLEFDNQNPKVEVCPLHPSYGSRNREIQAYWQQNFKFSETPKTLKQRLDQLVHSMRYGKVAKRHKKRSSFYYGVKGHVMRALQEAFYRAAGFRVL
jgi:hypothetical protein